MADYTVFDAGRTIRGDACTVLKKIRVENAKENQEIAKMDVRQYAQALIEDAAYFLPNALLDALKKEKFETDYDRALTYLSQMPTSGIGILTIHNDRNRTGSRVGA